MQAWADYLDDLKRGVTITPIQARHIVHLKCNF